MTHRASGSSATGARCSSRSPGRRALERARCADARRTGRSPRRGAGRHRHQAGRTPRRGQGVLCRRGPRRVRHPARSGLGSPHPAPTQRRAHPGPPRQADHDLRPRRHAWARVSNWPPSPTTVVAAPDTRIALPELGLGLVPGAGGTVSLPQRIGRLAHCMARLFRLRHRRGHGAASGAWSMPSRPEESRGPPTAVTSQRDLVRKRWIAEQCPLSPRQSGQPGPLGHEIETPVVRILGQVRRDSEHVDVSGQVLGPVVDEDGSAAADGKVGRQVAAVGVTTLLREVAADEGGPRGTARPGPGRTRLRRRSTGRPACVRRGAPGSLAPRAGATSR